MQVSERANVRSIEHHHRGCWVLAAHILKPTCPSFSFTANWDNVRQVCDTLVMLPMRYRYRHRKSRRNVLKANWRIGDRRTGLEISQLHTYFWKCNLWVGYRMDSLLPISSFCIFRNMLVGFFPFVFHFLWDESKQKFRTWNVSIVSA